MFDAPLGMQVATWFSSTPITAQDMSGVQASVMSGMDTLQATNMQMQVTLDAIATKLGISLVSGDTIQDAMTGNTLSGSAVGNVAPDVQPAKTKTPTSIDMKTTK